MTLRSIKLDLLWNVFLNEYATNVIISNAVCAATKEHKRMFGLSVAELVKFYTDVMVIPYQVINK